MKGKTIVNMNFATVTGSQKDGLYVNVEDLITFVTTNADEAGKLAQDIEGQGKPLTVAIARGVESGIRALGKGIEDAVERRDPGPRKEKT